MIHIWALLIGIVVLVALGLIFYLMENYPDVLVKIIIIVILLVFAYGIGYGILTELNKLT